jgi:hypothetical protein
MEPAPWCVSFNVFEELSKSDDARGKNEVNLLLFFCDARFDSGVDGKVAGVEEPLDVRRGKEVVKVRLHFCFPPRDQLR